MTWVRVDVAAPAVSGDTVVFRWTQSEPNPFQHENCFYLRYEGLDLTRFSSSLFYEIFLGLQLRVFKSYGRAVEVVFPEPVPHPTVAFWQAYHHADLVTIAPIAETASYSPWTSPQPTPQHRRPTAVFFGGGKDSMLTTCLLSELHGADSVLLLQFVHPFRRGPAELDRLARRQEELMLRPAREKLGVATQRAWTDYLAQFRVSRTGQGVRPHLELYSLGFLPALLEWGVSVCSPGIERSAYRAARRADGRLVYRYVQSRPEVLAAQSTHYRRVLGAELTVTNLNLLFTTLMDFRLLAERYPGAFEQVVMCVAPSPEERWCYQCLNCVEYAFFSLGLGIVDPRFDYDRFFAQSKYIERLIEYAESGVELSMFGNAPWQPFFSVAGHYLSFCHAIAQIEPRLLAARLGPDAFANLTVVKALFGNRRFPNQEMLSTKSVDLIGTDLARAVARIAAEHLEVVEDLPGPSWTGEEEVIFDFDVRIPTRTARLEHIRS
ncbi:MAG: hypothetical protein QOF33_4725 [Thermomicrobiales bacterium]|nr:hypothetical protein [Thermomicrobiales bacterium]